MSVLWFFRHGQGGTREHYDSLSEIGSQQACCLGDYLARQGIQFSSAWSGSMERQRLTAEAAGIGQARVDPGWDEFDLARVYAGLAPQLCDDDPEFRRQFEEMQASIERTRHDPSADVHRRWYDCDRTVVRAWVEGRYAFDGESWSRFRERILDTFARLQRGVSGEHTAVFTSATPIGICAAATFGLDDDRAFRFAGVLFNASITSFRLREAEVRLFTFNGVPHLDDAALRTFR